MRTYDITEGGSMNIAWRSDSSKAARDSPIDKWDTPKLPCLFFHSSDQMCTSPKICAAKDVPFHRFHERLVLSPENGERELNGLSHLLYTFLDGCTAYVLDADGSVHPVLPRLLP